MIIFGEIEIVEFFVLIDVEDEEVVRGDDARVVFGFFGFFDETFDVYVIVFGECFVVGVDIGW